MMTVRETVHEPHHPPPVAPDVPAWRRSGPGAAVAGGDATGPRAVRGRRARADGPGAPGGAVHAQRRPPRPVDARRGGPRLPADAHAGATRRLPRRPLGPDESGPQ